MDQPINSSDHSIEEVVRQITKLNGELARFWSKANGWAPIAAAELLSKSRLDRQVSISACLGLWVGRAEPLTDGELTLAWSNLGSLIEGTLKLFLSVYYEDYKADVDKLKPRGLHHRRTGKHISPDGVTLEPILQYFASKALLGKENLELAKLVQQRRNAIHSFKDRPLGDAAGFEDAVRQYLALLSNVDSRLPYPDEKWR